MRSLFGAVGLLTLLIGVATMATAPTITQEMAGLEFLLIAVVAGGFAKVIRLLEERTSSSPDED